MSETAPDKKKRRQNVACDPCKLRRVKCDLLSILSQAGSSTSTSEDDPAHVLVRRNPGVPCTNCRNKSIPCSTEGILNPIKPNKGGKRIEEARKLFGKEKPDHPRTDSGAPGFASRGPSSAAEFDPFASTAFMDAFALQPEGLVPPISGASDSANIAFFPFGQTQLPTNDAALLEEFISQALFSQDHPVSTSMLDAFPPSTPESLSTQPPSLSEPRWIPGTDQMTLEGRDPIQVEATEIWRRLSANTPKTIASHSLRESTPQPPTLSTYDIASHTPHPNTLIPALGKLNIETNQFMPILPAYGNPKDQQDQEGQRDKQPGTLPSDYAGVSVRNPLNEMIRYAGRLDRPTGTQNGKRQRVPDSMPSTPGSSFTTRMTKWEADPWHIWESPDDREQSLVAWGRKEQVQENLADRAIGIELSRHLITVYFQAVHFSLPVLSPESFYMEWEACGRRSDCMNPAQEALCAVIEAWAARYSDNPAVLGLPYQKAHTAPKVITADGQFTPGAQARAHWGKARLPVCNALLDRAGRIIDTNGIMRRPSITGLQTISLYNQLMHMSDQGSRVKDQWIQNMLVHSTIIEQMKLLQMFWTSGDPIVTSDDPTLDALQVRMKQRRLFWTTAVGDSCWSAATGQPPKMPLEELEAGRAWIDEVMDSLPDSTMKILAFFMKIWHRLAMVGRSVSQKITKHNHKMGGITVRDLCSTVQGIWAEIHSILSELNGTAIELLESCEPGILGFSPLNATSMRLCCPFFLLVLHEHIRNQQSFRKQLYKSYIIEQESETQAAGQRMGELAMLDQLHLQSVDVLLYDLRSQCAMFKELIPTGIIQSASIMIRVLIAGAQFLAEVPTNEQGYPATTLGGFGWTWDEKQNMVRICTDALYQIGWAWSDVGDVIEAVHLAMERMTPSPQSISQYQNLPPIFDPKIQQQRDREANIEAMGIQSALRFWPPKSIPTIISQARTGGYNLVSQLPRDVPGSDLGQHLPTSVMSSTQTSSGTSASTSTRSTAELSFTTSLPLNSSSSTSTSQWSQSEDSGPATRAAGAAGAAGRGSRVSPEMDFENNWTFNRDGNEPRHQQQSWVQTPSVPGHDTSGAQERVDRVLGFDLELFNAGMTGNQASNPWPTFPIPSKSKSDSTAESTRPIPDLTPSGSASASMRDPNNIENLPGSSNGTGTGTGTGYNGNIWDVMSGGRDKTDELDFDAFLNSFGTGEYTA